MKLVRDDHDDDDSEAEELKDNNLLTLEPKGEDKSLNPETSNYYPNGLERFGKIISSILFTCSG
jgi:hypothetical protein